MNILDFLPVKDQYYKKSYFKTGINSCDIGLVRSYSNNPFDIYIRNKICQITKGPFNHIFLCVKNGQIIEAETSGIKLNKFEKYIKNDDAVLIFKHLFLTEIQKKNILSFAYAQIGKKYDFLGILDFLIPFSIQDKTKYFCSELVFEAYQKANIKIVEKDKEISPNDIYYSIKKNKNFILSDYKNFNVSIII